VFPVKIIYISGKWPITQSGRTQTGSVKKMPGKIFYP
jgi:hypothetical protein